MWGNGGHGGHPYRLSSVAAATLRPIRHTAASRMRAAASFGVGRAFLGKAPRRFRKTEGRWIEFIDGWMDRRKKERGKGCC